MGNVGTNRETSGSSSPVPVCLAFAPSSSKFQFSPRLKPQNWIEFPNQFTREFAEKFRTVCFGHEAEAAMRISRPLWEQFATSLIAFAFSVICEVQGINAINCYDCRSEDVSCNVGECIGATCVKMETSNYDNDRKTVSKGCSNEFEDNQCKQSSLGPKIVLRCTCDSNFCNGDRNLAAAGLQSMPDGEAGKFANNFGKLISTSLAFFAIFMFHFR